MILHFFEANKHWYQQTTGAVVVAEINVCKCHQHLNSNRTASAPAGKAEMW